LQGSKDLVSQDLIGPVRKSAHQARSEFRKYSLPFPINSVYLISKEALSTIDEKLQGDKSQFWVTTDGSSQVFSTNIFVGQI
jgi:hypothetical protein